MSGTLHFLLLIVCAVPMVIVFLPSSFENIIRTIRLTYSGIIAEAPKKRRKSEWNTPAAVHVFWKGSNTFLQQSIVYRRCGRSRR